MQHACNSYHHYVRLFDDAACLCNIDPMGERFTYVRWMLQDWKEKPVSEWPVGRAVAQAVSLRLSTASVARFDSDHVVDLLLTKWDWDMFSPSTSFPLPTSFRRLCRLQRRHCLLEGHVVPVFYPEYGSSMLFRYAGSYLLNYMALRRRIRV
jgi:hypothetical protein